ncbi:MAG: hypothetical protein KC657_09120 [Myxococcales bacterium]|nr:hypothetical protein [Myxococcales bacterium]
MALSRWTLLLCAPLALTACPKKTDAPADAQAAPRAEAGADAGSDGGDDDDVKPAYPTDVKPHPLATKLCEGLHHMPETRRAECCHASEGVVLTSECVRALSAALEAKAVTLAETDVDTCISAFAKLHEGCDWVGPFGPAPPTECQGLIKGHVAKGARCRSSLECEGSLRCLGVGPTTLGRCGDAKANGDACGGTTDPLANPTRQTAYDTQHPECRERCIKHRCGTPVPEKGDCAITADCAEGLLCVPDKGLTGLRAARGPKKCEKREPAKLGQPCPGGACEGGASCVGGKCIQKKGAGEACTLDFECKGGCLRADGGTKGTCGPKCESR